MKFEKKMGGISNRKNAPFFFLEKKKNIFYNFIGKYLGI